jgi:2-polyprenyl-6-methoxyphenol hydroxylase-like FAD-dependent oxidoreductase
LVTPAVGFPLRLMRAPRTVLPRLALIGDAAHTIHPLSGHGINLGFQDAQSLAATLAACPPHIDCGDVQWLRRHERARREEVQALQAVTHGLQRLFDTPAGPLAAARNLGMNFVDRLPVLKDALVRYAMG